MNDLVSDRQIVMGSAVQSVFVLCSEGLNVHKHSFQNKTGVTGRLAGTECF